MVVWRVYHWVGRWGDLTAATKVSHLVEHWVYRLVECSANLSAAETAASSVDQWACWSVASKAGTKAETRAGDWAVNWAFLTAVSWGVHWAALMARQ